MTDRSWAWVVAKVRHLDEGLADELTNHFLQAGYAYSRLIAKIIDKKENN